MVRFKTPTRFAPLSAWLTAAFVCVASVIIAIAVHRSESRQAAKDYENHCQKVTVRLVNRLRDNEAVLHSAAALFSASNAVDRDEWRAFIQALQLAKRHPGILGTGYAEIIAPEDLSHHVDQIRSQGFPDYKVWPDQYRETYTSIIYLEPFSWKNQKSFGYDMFTESARREAMERARDQGTSALTKKTFLLHDDGLDAQTGTLMFVPVYRNGMPVETVQQRRAAIQGWVYSPYRMKEMMGRVLTSAPDAGAASTEIEVFDGESPFAKQLLYGSDEDQDDGRLRKSDYERIVELEIFGRSWTIRFTPSSARFPAASKSRVGTCIGVGMFTSGLVFWLVVLLRRTRRQVGDLRKVQSALNVSQERFDLAIEGSQVGLWDWNLNTSCVFCSSRWNKILGIDQPGAERHIDQVVELIHPDDRKRFMDSVDDYLAGAEIQYESELRMQRTDGEIVHVLLRGFAIGRDNSGIPTRFTGTCIDVTERKKHEVALRQFKTTLDLMEESVFMFRPSTLQFFYANQGALESLGCSEDELLELSALDIWPEFEEDEFRQILDKITSGQDASTEFEATQRLARCDGFSAEVHVQYVSPEHGTPRFVAVARDISKRLEVEQTLRQAKDAAEKGSRAKSEFLANMSHEIRTPLNGILGFSEVLSRSDNLNAEQIEQLGIVKKSGQHLLGLVDDILDISKIEAQQIEMNVGRCSPHGIIREVLSLLRVRAQEKGISLECEWCVAVPETIETDGVRLRQILMNLVGNSIKFTSEGSVRLFVSIDELGALPQLVIDVQDTGIGISDDHLKTIFKPFNQADGSITRRFGGTGLGLTISRHLAQSLGGDITVSSTLGQGTVFQLRVGTGSLEDVRILEQAVSESVSIEDTGLEVPSQDLSGLNLLVCEDGETNRALIGYVLISAGAEVTFAENGQEGIEAMQNTETPFDLVFMDMQMPVLDGYRASTQLRSLGFDTPIIALTAHAMRGDQEKCLAAGCTGYLAKPINIDRLLQAVAQTIPRRSAFQSKTGNASEGSVPAIGVIGSSDADTDLGEADSSPIYSSLSMKTPVLRDIAVCFVETLESRLEMMQEAINVQQGNDLAEHAHWLRGAGGTIGFDCFTEPAEALEANATEGDLTQAQRILDQIRTLSSRLSIEPQEA